MDAPIVFVSRFQIAEWASPAPRGDAARRRQSDGSCDRASIAIDVVMYAVKASGLIHH
jgi:hypothetical protein